GSPWTLACYMVQGGSSRDFARVRALAYGQPALMHVLLEKLALSVTDYLNAQIRAGAQAVQMFDTWGGLSGTEAYAEFTLRWMSALVAGLIREHEGRRVPVILVTKGGGQWLEAMAASGAQALGLTWTADIGVARAQVGGSVALQGNMD